MARKAVEPEDTGKLSGELTPREIVARLDEFDRQHNSSTGMCGAITSCAKTTRVTKLLGVLEACSSLLLLV